MLPEPVRYLIDAGRRAPSADNSQPWRFIWGGGSLAVAFDEARGGDMFGATDHATMIAMGAVAENMVSAAQTAGLRVQWSFPSGAGVEGQRYVCGSLDPAATLLSDSNENPLFHRHTNRNPYRRTPWEILVLDGVSGPSDGTVKIAVLDSPQALSDVKRLVRIASEMRFANREIHEWFVKSLRFSAQEVAAGDGLDVATLALPPGGSLLLRAVADWRRMALFNRLGAAHLFARIEAHSITACSKVLAIVGAGAPDEWIAAGRLMERVWCRLNGEGIAVQPYYVVTDQLLRLSAGKIPVELDPQACNLKEMTVDLLGNEADFPHMFLRTGYPRRAAVSARRLPMERVSEEQGGVSC